MNSKRAKIIKAHVFHDYYGLCIMRSANDEPISKKDMRQAKGAIKFKAMCRAARRNYLKTAVTPKLKTSRRQERLKLAS